MQILQFYTALGDLGHQSYYGAHQYCGGESGWCPSDCPSGFEFYDAGTSAMVTDNTVQINCIGGWCMCLR